MNRVTTEEIIEAKKYDLLTYLLLAKPHEVVRVSGKRYSMRTHDSMRIEDGMWYRFSTGEGGHTALDYLVKVEGYDFVDAVKEVLIVCSGRPLPEHTAERAVLTGKPKEKKPFALPERASANDLLIRYLLGRGIHKDVLRYCISNGLIYESDETIKTKSGRIVRCRNAVFCGMDENGTVRYAVKRAFNDRRFFMEVESSDKRYGFCMGSAAKNDTSELRVFESAIDAMSEASLSLLETGQWQTCSRLALGGVTKKGRELHRALEEYLRRHKPQHIVMCLDNDAAGIAASATISDILLERGFSVEYRPPQLGKDYNDFLSFGTGRQPRSRSPVCHPKEITT